MKIFLKFILAIIVFLILVVVVMAVFRICPPPGPWPMPPWCSQEKASTVPAGTQVKVEFYASVPYTVKTDEPIYLAVEGLEPLEMEKYGELGWRVKGNKSLLQNFLKPRYYRMGRLSVMQLLNGRILRLNLPLLKV